MNKNYHFRAVLLASLLVIVPSVADAAIALPVGMTVSNDAGGATGTTIELGDVSADDELSFSVTGTPYLQGPGLYGVNAAGVTTTAGIGTGVGAMLPDYSSNFTYGALIATLNGAISRQVFASNATNGLGSLSVPDRLSYFGSLASLFGVSGALRSATLNFRVDDTGYTDNSGSFQIDGVAAVPEPATWAMMLVGFGGIGFAMRRRKSKMITALAHA